MAWVRSVASFRDFLSLAIVHAPDDFPVEDHLAADEQLTLDRAFDELHHGVDLLGGDAVLCKALHARLDEAHAAYRAGLEREGARLLHAVEREAFSTP
jgi:hypothetical protein